MANMTPIRHLLCCLVAFVALGTHAKGAPADDAAASLLRLVPDDPALCLIIEDLRGHVALLKDSGVAEAVLDSPLARLLPEGVNREFLAEVERILKDHLQSSLKELVDEVLGDAVVLAYWSPTGGHGERSVILSKARDPQRAVDLLQRLHRLQGQSGQLEQVERRTVGSASYYHCRMRGEPDQFQAVHQGVVVLTQDETTLRHVLASLAAAPKESGLARRAAALNGRRVFLRLLLAPRSFEADLTAKAETAPPEEANFLKAFLVYWKALKSVGLALSLDPEPSLTLHVEADTATLPQSAQRLLREAAKPSELREYVPKNAMLALGARLDPEAFWECLLPFLPPDSQKTLGEELERNTRALVGLAFRDEILRQLGPDAVFYLAPPADLLSLTPEVVLAIKVQADNNREKVEADLGDALKTLAGIIALAWTQAGRPTALHTRHTATGRVVYLTMEGMPIPGLQPAAGVRNGCVVVALSPNSVLRFRRREASPLAVAPNDGILIGRLTSQPLLDGYLNHPVYRPILAGLLVIQNGGNLPEANGQLDTLRDTLKLFESLELRYRPQGESGSLELRLRMARASEN